MPQLDNPRHEAFAQAVACGQKGAEAYRKVYGEHQRNARSSASALLKDNPDISQRVLEISQRAATGAVMTLQEEMEYLTRAILTPIDQIDETSVLCQRVKRTADGTVEYWCVDKLGSMRLLADLKKELSTNVNLDMKIKIEITAADVLAAQKRMPELQGLC